MTLEPRRLRISDYSTPLAPVVGPLLPDWSRSILQVSLPLPRFAVPIPDLAPAPAQPQPDVLVTQKYLSPLGSQSSPPLCCAVTLEPRRFRISDYSTPLAPVVGPLLPDWPRPILPVSLPLPRFPVPTPDLELAPAQPQPDVLVTQKYLSPLGSQSSPPGSFYTYLWNFLSSFSAYAFSGFFFSLHCTVCTV